MANIVAPVGVTSLPGGGIVRLTFAVQSGSTYQVEYKNDLSNISWLRLGAPVLAVSDTVVVDDSIVGQRDDFIASPLCPDAKWAGCGSRRGSFAHGVKN